MYAFIYALYIYEWQAQEDRNNGPFTLSLLLSLKKLLCKHNNINFGSVCFIIECHCTHWLVRRKITASCMQIHCVQLEYKVT